MTAESITLAAILFELVSYLHWTSGRVVKQEQWERWRAKQQLVSESLQALQALAPPRTALVVLGVGADRGCLPPPVAGVRGITAGIFLDCISTIQLKNPAM